MKKIFALAWLALGILSGCSSKGANCACPEIYSPVCSTQTHTYSSRCHAVCAGATVAYDGACGKVDCSQDNECAWFADVCSGSCFNRNTPPEYIDPCSGQPPDKCLRPGCASQPQENCFCNENKCASSTLTAGQTCDPNRDMCRRSQFLKCCPPQGGTNSDAASGYTCVAASAGSCPN